jgi:hypothetical protein
VIELAERVGSLVVPDVDDPRTAATVDAHFAVLEVVPLVRGPQAIRACRRMRRRSGMIMAIGGDRVNLPVSELFRTGDCTSAVNGGASAHSGTRHHAQL